jgi:uncharacterized cupin superfamily protein
MSEQPPIVVNVENAQEIERKIGDHWGAVFKILTPGMRPRGGSLGVKLMRVAQGRVTVPFHTHQREDEVFYVLSGRGVLRYGEELTDLRPGDCVSCPAGTGVAHQIANPHEEDLVYLAIGNQDPHEVCTYPDSGKVLIRSLDRTIGRIERTEYMDGEPERPKILELIDDRG